MNRDAFKERWTEAPVAEANAFCDPEAAAEVFAALGGKSCDYSKVLPDPPSIF